jgi:hypothetical protein
MTILVQPQMIDPTAPFGPGAITGLLPSAIAGTNTTASLTVSAGAAVDSSNARLLTLANAYSWSVTTGYQGGTTLPNSATIHFFLCGGSSGVLIWAHTGLVPTAPAGFTSWYRRIISIPTTAAGALVGGTAIELAGGAVRFYLTIPIADYSASSLGTARVLVALSVPTGIRLLVFLRATSTTQANAQVISPDEPDLAPTNGVAAPGRDVIGNATTGIAYGPTPTTDTSGRVALRSDTASTNLNLVTRGWEDWRRN